MGMKEDGNERGWELKRMGMKRMGMNEDGNERGWE